MSRPNKASRAEGTGFVLKDFVPFQLAVLTDAVSRRLAQEYGERFGLSIAEWRVLSMVSQEETVRAQMVADETPLDKVAVSRAVAALDEKGLITKSASPEDRRAALIRLTAKGRTVAEEIQTRALAFEDDLVSILSAPERRQLADLLSRLTERAKAL